MHEGLLQCEWQGGKLPSSLRKRDNYQGESLHVETVIVVEMMVWLDLHAFTSMNAVFQGVHRFNVDLTSLHGIAKRMRLVRSLI